MKLIVCGGGTGGHVYPALAIAEYFKSKIDDIEIIYIGGKYGIENKILKNYDYKFETLDIKGFQRKINFENVKRAFKAFTSMHKVKKILKREKPDLVIGTGGYVCGPVIYEASKMKIKTAILEANVFMGMTNKILSKKADYIFYGFEETLKRYPFENAVVSGNPIRIKEFEIDKKTARQQLNLKEDEKVVLSVGGSGGSESLNKVIKDLIEFLNQNNATLIHATGDYYYDEMMQALGEYAKKDKVKIMPYINDIGKYIQASDMVICSAGASTLSELTYFGKPMLVIPKAYTAENHQLYNAKMIEDAKAGYYIKENELDGEKIKEKVKKILFEGDNLNIMSKNSKNLSKDDACRIIYDTIMEK